MRTLKVLSFAAVCSAGALTTLAPTVAEACGGTFCDQGPTQMPVDQTGENVIFVMEDGMVEAHIQIQYDPSTTAEQFAWVVPVARLPEFEVGSEILFDNVLSATVPTYGLNTQFDTCGMQSTSGVLTTGAGGDSGGESGGSATGDGGGGPEVLFEETVGAFDITVLSGGTAQEVMDWLDANGYQQDPEATPILDEYLSEGFMFVAMKLNHQSGLDQIHPIVIKYPFEVPCVPLRLTRIAAADDMNVRVFFLGNERVVPTNYRHVEVNPLKIDWVNLASNYVDVISLAVDADGADGHAFVTEYAGTDANVQTWNLHDTAWNSAAVGAITDPATTIDVLSQQGMLDCFGGYYGCQYNHPLIQGILAQYLPVPAGVSEAEFYADLPAYSAMIDLAAWDAAAFATDYQARIIDPGLNAKTIVETYPYITRMYTTISDYEMDLDPIFEKNSDLPDVAQLRQATQQIHCDMSAHMTLPDGREVYMPNSSAWPSEIGGDEMPWEEHVQEGTISGPLMTTVDQTELIDDLLAEWNDRSPDPMNPTGCACSVGPTGPLGAIAGFGLFGLLALGRRRRS